MTELPSNTASYTLSVVVPAYNEVLVLPEFHRRVKAVLEQLGADYEVLYVNDGSTDGTLETIYRLQAQDPRVSVVDLSRNFGKEIALSAGLDHARGDAVVVIDADLQDPPELIPEMVRRWREGYDNVYAKRTAREGETLLKRVTSHAFYRVIQRFSGVHIPNDTGDFRLLSRRAVESLRRLREQHRFMKGLFAWIGYRGIAVPYKRDSRAAGKTKWSYWKLWNFAIEGITSFSTAPLRVASYFGMFIAATAFFFAAWVVFKTLVFGEQVQGFPTIMVTILFLGGVQLMAIGMLGEYIGRMFNETKARPLYFVSDYSPGRTIGEAQGLVAGQPSETCAPKATTSIDPL
jgi:glycosyltransferase involved in cell wall biosynthesis